MRRMEEDPEAQALDALRREDRDRALTLLMRAYGAELYHFCRQMVGDEQAEDLAQLVFLQAYEGFSHFGHKSSLRAWLYGIARNRCIDAGRRKQRLQAEPPEPSPDEACEHASLDDQLDARGVLEQCLGRLGPEAREAVILRYLQGLSYVEMAEICGVEPATLQMRVARSLPRLRKCIASRSQE
jgi:RNA polymerase sigma-70 factor, ECF subfamily